MADELSARLVTSRVKAGRLIQFVLENDGQSRPAGSIFNSRCRVASIEAAMERPTTIMLHVS